MQREGVDTFICLEFGVLYHLVLGGNFREGQFEGIEELSQ